MIHLSYFLWPNFPLNTVAKQKPVWNGSFTKR